MVFGNKTNIRYVWLVGAGLLGIVVVKLFLVELNNVGTVGRIISFIAVGGIMLVIGYLTPLPPGKKENV
jgi:uncharacterized membrane protein